MDLKSNNIREDYSVISDLPKSSGTYALHLHLLTAIQLNVGKLGEFNLPGGDYLYLGSAFNPGGLKARLGRHLRGGGILHWHIDYLRAEAMVNGYHYVIQDNDITPTMQPLECLWSQAVATLPGARFHIPGFGAGDCRAGCPAHLITLQIKNDDFFESTIRKVLLSRSYSYKLISHYMR
jgi:Uri superfamily endonuclease